jgi:hypothetical protein
MGYRNSDVAMTKDKNMHKLGILETRKLMIIAT